MANSLTRSINTQHQYLVVLVALLFLFCLRILGQFLVAFFHVPFLPPMEEWFSGVIPYCTLFACQLLIIILYSKVCFDFTTRGFFSIPQRKLATFLLPSGTWYLTIMLVRYAIRMTLYPHERWFGGSIPIFFHFVLASFVIVLGLYHRSAAKRSRSRSTVLVACLTHVLIGLCLLIWSGYQLLPSIAAHQFGWRSAQYAVRSQSHVPLKTSDGTTLIADIYQPQHVQKTPTILVRIPLTKTPKNALLVDLTARAWAERGYTVVMQYTRGRSGSGGTFYPLRFEHEDGIDTLNWLKNQSWFNGEIATWGGSAFGYTQWAIADQTNPGPTVFEIYESSSNFYDMFYQGGAFSLASALSWAITSHGAVDLPSWPAIDAINSGAKGFPLLNADRRATGKDIDFFKDWVSHCEHDSYWTNIDGLNRNQKLKSPALLLAGWYDPFLITQLKDFKEIRHSASHRAQESCLIIGPWTHARQINSPLECTAENFRLATLATSLPWFDQVLKVATDKRGPSPRVRIYVMGLNKWRDEDEWPLARAHDCNFFLDSSGKANGAGSDGALLSQPASSGEDSFIYDPRNPVPTSGGAMIGKLPPIAKQNQVESRPDVLQYTTAPLLEDTEVTGPIKVVLYVSTSALSTDFTAKLVDVWQDGTAYNVSDGILRRRYERSTSNKNQIYAIQIDLQPTSMVFMKGHKIRLEVSSSNFPRFDRNPNTGNCVATEMSPVTASQRVHHGIQFPSRLVLPIVPANRNQQT